MEMPHLGQNCSQSTCNQLDFLPVKCDACEKIFCKDHYQYSHHNCPESYKKNKQVPVCPLCNTPIPTKAGVSPDVTVGQHIDRNCESDSAVAKRKAVYTNKCSLKGCKQREVVPIKCEDCKLNFCLKHRHAQDHKCTQAGSSRPTSRPSTGGQSVFRMKTSSSTGSVPSAGATAAAPPRGRGPITARTLTTSPTSTNPINVLRLQGNLSDDEALAAALQLSLMAQQRENGGESNGHLRRRDDDDYLLARAIAASQADEEERERRLIRAREQRNASKRSSCFLS